MSLFTMCAISLMTGTLVGGGIVHIMWRRNIRQKIVDIKEQFNAEHRRLKEEIKTREKEAKVWHYRATAALRIHDR